MWVSFNLCGRQAQPGDPFSLDRAQSAHDLRLAFALAVDKKKLVTSVCADIACSAATAAYPEGLIGYMGDGSRTRWASTTRRAKQLSRARTQPAARPKGLRLRL